jgi:hypothetical protein
MRRAAITLISGIAICALAGCTSSSTTAEKTPSGAPSTCPPLTVQPSTSAVAEVAPPQTHPAIIVPAATPPSGGSSSKEPGLPSDGHTQSVAFYDYCTQKTTQVILLHVTISVLNPESADRHYEVAHVAIETGGHPLPYGPADFRFVAANGHTYDPVTATTPEPSTKVLGPGTLAAGVEAVGDVIFDVPKGGGKVTYRSELGGSTLAWPTSS